MRSYCIFPIAYVLHPKACVTETAANNRCNRGIIFNKKDFHDAIVAYLRRNPRLFSDTTKILDVSWIFPRRP